MKNKKFNKKLVLNKHTVSDLSAAAQSEVRGGIFSLVTCPGYCDSDQSCAHTDCTACYTWADCSLAGPNCTGRRGCAIP